MKHIILMTIVVVLIGVLIGITSSLVVDYMTNMPSTSQTTNRDAAYEYETVTMEFERGKTYDLSEMIANGWQVIAIKISAESAVPVETNTQQVVINFRKRSR